MADRTIGPRRPIKRERPVDYEELSDLVRGAPEEAQQVIHVNPAAINEMVDALKEAIEGWDSSASAQANLKAAKDVVRDAIRSGRVSAEVALRIAGDAREQRTNRYLNRVIEDLPEGSPLTNRGTVWNIIRTAAMDEMSASTEEPGASARQVDGLVEDLEDGMIRNAMDLIQVADGAEDWHGTEVVDAIRKGGVAVSNPQAREIVKQWNGYVQRIRYGRPPKRLSTGIWNPPAKLVEVLDAVLKGERSSTEEAAGPDLIDPIAAALERKGRAPQRRARPQAESAAHARKCVNHACSGEMMLAASRGRRVLFCRACSTSLPVTAEWQITGDSPPRDAIDEKAGSVAGDPLDMHRAAKRRDIDAASDVIAVPGASETLDTSWLKPASAKLNISPSIKDYVMVPVILFYASVPNRNGLGFLESDLVEWSTEHKVPAYKTWRGAPMHVEHDNADPSKAVGVVLDTSLRKHPAEPAPFWKNVAYLAVDRGKDPKIAKAVLRKEISTYSMGCYVNGGYRCSICAQASCGHILPPTARRKTISIIEDGVAIDVGSGAKRTLMDGRTGLENEKLPGLPVLAFAVAKNPVGFEVSVVKSPAFPMAGNDQLQTW